MASTFGDNPQKCVDCNRAFAAANETADKRCPQCANAHGSAVIDLAREFWERCYLSIMENVPTREAAAAAEADAMLVEWRARFDKPNMVVDSEKPDILRREWEAHADGVAQERERCAKLAEEFSDFQYKDQRGNDPAIVLETASMGILAAQIRSGE